MNEVVKYDNYMNALKFNGFTSTDLNMLMALCSKMKNKDTDTVSFQFEDLKELMNYKPTSNTRFIDELERMNKKLMQITCSLRTETKSIMFVLFPTFITDFEKQNLTVSVNQQFSFVLNELTKNFTRFELAQFIELNSKYSKNFYRLLKQYRTTGIYRVSIDEFRDKMDCPKSYGNKYFMDQIIKPAIKELSPYFDNLKCDPMRSNRRGRPIIGYEFSFGAEIVTLESKVNSVATSQQIASKKANKSKNQFTSFDSRSYSPDELAALESKLLNGID